MRPRSMAQSRSTLASASKREGTIANFARRPDGFVDAHLMAILKPYSFHVP